MTIINKIKIIDTVRNIINQINTNFSNILEDKAEKSYVDSTFIKKVDVDNSTIHLDSNEDLEVIGVLTKNNVVKYDWIGTLANWEEGRQNGTIPDSWICYVTDDGVEA